MSTCRKKAEKAKKKKTFDQSHTAFSLTKEESQDRKSKI